jgi:hypothetical protein
MAESTTAEILMAGADEGAETGTPEMVSPVDADFKSDTKIEFKQWNGEVDAMKNKVTWLEGYRELWSETFMKIFSISQ